MRSLPPIILVKADFQVEPVYHTAPQSRLTVSNSGVGIEFHDLAGIGKLDRLVHTDGVLYISFIPARFPPIQILSIFPSAVTGDILDDAPSTPSASCNRSLAQRNGDQKVPVGSFWFSSLDQSLNFARRINR
jgi:hypothetical protein